MSTTGNKVVPLVRRALERWPKDALRPDCQFQNVFAKRLENGSIAPPGVTFGSAAAREQAELRQANALYVLLENRFMDKYKLSNRMMKPKFNPTYYKDLLTELEEAPNRSWTTRIVTKLRGMFRLQ